MKILAVSFAYPPLAYPRSIQVARLLKHAAAETVVVCAEEPGARLDQTIEPDAEAALKACVRVPITTKSSTIVDKLAFRFAAGLWNRRNLVPDRYGAWKTDVLGRIYKHIDNLKPDVIVTFAQPFTDHLIGLEMKNRLGLPWLAHFSDPWADNPFAPFDEKTHKLNLALERSVAEHADMLIFTSAETADLFLKKYPPAFAEKARVLPQCYDPKLFAARNNRRSGPIVIRYLGNFYGKRTPRPLIESLKTLIENKPGLLDDVVFELIGPGDADEVTRLAGALPKGLLSARPSVDYRESLDLMSDSDGLLIIDAPAETSVFLPSKLIDYIGAGRPVLGITPPGTASSLLRDLGGAVADPTDICDIAEGLEHFIGQLNERRAANSIEDWGESRTRERFTAERVASEFSSLLEELTTGH